VSKKRNVRDVSDDEQIVVDDDADMASQQKHSMMKARASIEHDYCHICSNNVNLIDLSNAIKQKEKEIEDLKAKIESLMLRRAKMTVGHIKNNAQKVQLCIVKY
jgi:transcription initiation factor IIE alpha subunit